MNESEPEKTISVPIKIFTLAANLIVALLAGGGGTYLVGHTSNDIDNSRFRSLASQVGSNTNRLDGLAQQCIRATGDINGLVEIARDNKKDIEYCKERGHDLDDRLKKIEQMRYWSK